MKLLLILVVLLGLSKDVNGQVLDSAKSSDSIRTIRSTSEQLGLGALQIGAATVGFLVPMVVAMPNFIDSARDRSHAFILFPLSVMAAGLSLGTNLVGGLMGGGDNYAATILGAGVGFVAGTRGWTEHTSRTARYLHFSAPIIAGAVSFYWIANVFSPSSSVNAPIRIDPIIGRFNGVSFELRL